ncbi:MAG: branched-chain amino acid ABC transporter permease [Actinomycetota bacterium]|nr:branched-chain amino acid ABC transporter permease [Actinomycetota bacterium]
MTLTNKAKLSLLVLGLIAAFAAPYMFRPFTVSIITLALIFGLYAMSIDLMGGYGGLVSLGHAGIFATGAYGVGYVASRLSGPTSEQVLIGMAAGLAVTAVFALMAMRVAGTYFLMVTLAQGMIVWGFATRSTELGAENGLTGVTRPEAFAPYWKFYYLCLAVLLLCGALMWVIVRSPFGLSLRGLKNSPTRLQMLGYNPALTKFYVFMLAGLFGTVSGILYAYYNQFVSPSNAVFATSGKGVLMAILGGIGTLIGPLIGAFVIVFIENVLSVHIARWPTLLGLLFIFTILGARKGLVGALSDGWYRWVPGVRPERSARASSSLESADNAEVAEVKTR